MRPRAPRPTTGRRAWDAFDDRGPLLLDNQHRDGRAGVRAYRVFRPEGAAPLLVDLGWLPLPGDRALPAIALPRGRIEVRGLLAPPPSPGPGAGQRHRDARRRLAADAAWTPARVAQRWRCPCRWRRACCAWTRRCRSATRATSNCCANTLPPERHRGYAVQWFALALAVLVTALILTFRKARQ